MIKLHKYINYLLLFLVFCSFYLIFFFIFFYFRGAELKEELQRKRVAEQEDEEKNILEKIRQKMDRIKANQKRIQGPTFMEKQHKETSHCAGKSILIFIIDSKILTCGIT